MFLGIDVGGTFTDLVAYDPAGGTLKTVKVPSQPPRFWPSVVDCLEQASLPAGRNVLILHGTTVHLNAFLERKGARTALVTTKGFADVYEMRRGNRTRPYDLHFQYPQPIVSRRHIYEVAERTRADGAILKAPCSDDVNRIARSLNRENYQSVAVCLLHSYRNPENEQQVKALLLENCQDLFVTASSDFCREWREYERTSTVIFNAYVSPVLRHYLNLLCGELEKRVENRLFLLQSNGGLMSAGEAEDQGVLTLLSGPVGGNVACRALSRQTGHSNLICIDMGGTSFEASLIIGGEPALRNEREVGDFPILAPMIDIHTIGAGGGSIAWSEAGSLKVGPHSAGADPGPACYGRGGVQATVTDANLALGRINHNSALARKLGLNRQLAIRALDRLGDEVGLSPIPLAQGVLDVINERMANAIRTITVRRGIDPRQFTLVAYGGAGPMHAAEIASLLGIQTVVVPRSAGAFSAWGMLQSDLVHDQALSTLYSLNNADWNWIGKQFDYMRQSLESTLKNEGAEDDSIEFVYSLDLRYQGQEYSITVPLPAGFLSGGQMEPPRPSTLKALFDSRYQTIYGHMNPEEEAEISALRLQGIGKSAVDFQELMTASERRESSHTEEPRRSGVIFGGREFETLFLPRDSLTGGEDYPGPLVIEELTATTVVPPGFQATVDRLGNLTVNHRET